MAEELTLVNDFKMYVARTAQKAMVAVYGSAQGKRAAAKTALAFAEAASRAKDPSALYSCSYESVASCVATAAEVGINPGGPYPKAYLVPRGGHLNYEITHRGIAVVAQREGFAIRAVPVHIDDPVLTLEFGEVSEHEADPDSYPAGLDDLRGVYVSMTRLSDGANMGRPWVPVALIRKRAESRQAGPVWRSWPVEMAQKTAIKHCVARGMIVIDSDDLDIAFSAEPEVVEVSTVERTAPESRRLTEDLPNPMDTVQTDTRERVETAGPAADETATPPAAAPVDQSRDAMKKQIMDLEQRVGDDNADRVRKEGGMPPEGVRTWKHGVGALQAHIVALEAELVRVDREAEADDEAARMANAGGQQTGMGDY